MLPQEIIRRKRDGGALGADDIAAFIAGLTSGAVSEGQVAAFAMAVFFNGMDFDECVALTRAMTNSGSRLDWSGFDRPILDKHSTGGVGDNVSLMLAPMLAACGAYVPMISGRGLGHTGGTLDKLDSIPGYCTQPALERLRATIAAAGCAIIGQTDDLAPADRRLYAIRDVTATVESIPLITASILSKKLAAGLQGLVLDVKTGSGAFMPDLTGARALARSLAGVAAGAGLKSTAVITDMNEPLASAAGNALEVANAAAYLTGATRDARLHEVTLALGAQALLLGRLAADAPAARAALERALASGAAAERFERMVAGLGGPTDFLKNFERHLPSAPICVPAFAPSDGYVVGVDVRALGLAVVRLGGGRARADDRIDAAVGLSQLAGLGAPVGQTAPLGFVHARDEEAAQAGVAALVEAYKIAQAPSQLHAPVVEIVSNAA